MAMGEQIRYEFDWKVDDANGDCIARVTRCVFMSITEKPIKKTKFQIHISKYVFRMYPWPGQETFERLSEDEYEKVATTARSFYAGANRHDSFFFWELEKPALQTPAAIVEISEPNSIVKKQKVPKKAKARAIWQKTT